MCGRFTITASVGEIARRFNAGVPDSYTPRYNAAPGQDLPIILDDNPGQVVMARWGLVPHWSRDAKGFINARSESASEKPAFRGSFRKRRCLVIADGFYEWEKKVPYRFTVSHGLFSMAGLWYIYGVEGGSITTFTILTTEPNEVVSRIHHRMPVILSKADEEAWLKEGPEEVLKPFPAMSCTKVSAKVNDVRNEGPELIRPSGQTTLA